MLTKKQSDLLRYLYARQEEGAFISPSYDEMRDAMGLKSKCGIHRLVVCLEERGFIERLPQRPRSIRVLAGPGEAPRRPVTPQDLKELVSRLVAQEGPEVAIAALSECAAQVAALFISVEGHA